jgi:hypothetical protein
MKIYETLNDFPYELIGSDKKKVLDAVNTLRFYYGDKNINISADFIPSENDEWVVGMSFPDSITLRSSGDNPRSNIVREMNYALREEEIGGVRLIKVK